MKTNLILGFFDGVHIAHRAVIESAWEHKNIDSKIVLVTLKDSPAFYFNGKKEYIFPREESIKIIRGLGVDEIIELDFSLFKDIPAEKYIEYLVDTFSPISISTGYNHTFGYNKGGDSDLLYSLQKKYAYKYVCIGEQTLNEETISSTNIKKHLFSGDIKNANLLLGSMFFIEGNVIYGNQLGRELGYPTANVNYPDEIVKIPYGVYKTSLVIDAKVYDAIMNWGIKPTVGDEIKPVAEIHIINYSGDLYGKNIRVNIISKIRDEIRFNSLEDLKLQIEKDINVCLKS